MATGRLLHRPQHGELVGDPRLPGEELRELHPGDLRLDRLEGPTVLARDIGLGVVGVDVGGATGEPNHDHGGRLLAGGRRLGPRPENTGEREPPEAGHADAEELAAPHRAGVWHRHPSERTGAVDGKLAHGVASLGAGLTGPAGVTRTWIGVETRISAMSVGAGGVA